MNKRWIVVRTVDGETTMVDPVQGRYTFDTADRAYDRLRAISGGNNDGTYGIRCVECWPDHNDPVSSVY